MKQRSIRIIADYLAHHPIGRIVSVLPVGDDAYVLAIEDRRDGREHVMETGRLGHLDGVVQTRTVPATSTWVLRLL